MSQTTGARADALGHIVLVGAGNMGGAMLRRWPDGARITVVDPSPSEEIVAHLRERGAALRGGAEDAEPAGLLVVAIKPQLMEVVLPTLRGLVEADTTVVSIAAGTTVATLAEALGTERVVRTIPNTPAMVGQGVTGAFAAAAVDGAARERVGTLLGCSGEVVWVEREEDIDRVTAVSGSGPAYVFHLVEAVADAARGVGLDGESADRLARQTVIGASALLAASEEDPARLRERVTSKGGTTAAALRVLMDEKGGLTELMGRAVGAAHNRAVELGRGE